MSSFTQGIKTKKIDGKRRELLESFTYYIGEEDSDDFVIVPKGFVSDGLSIPPWAWVIVGHPWSKAEQAAWVHDFLYIAMTRSKKESDLIFLEAMKVLGVSWWKRNIMYRAVRMNFPKAMKWKRNAKKNN